MHEDVSAADLGAQGWGHMSPVLEEDEGVTLLAPKVKPRGLAPDQQLAQSNRGLSELLWTPKICWQGPAAGEVSTQKLRSDLSWAQVSPFRRLWGVCGDILPRARVWQRPAAPGHHGLALTQPREGPGGSGSSRPLLAGCQSPVTSAAGMSCSPRRLGKDKLAGQVFVPSVLLSLQAHELAGTPGAGILPCTLEGAVPPPSLSPGPFGDASRWQWRSEALPDTGDGHRAPSLPLPERRGHGCQQGEGPHPPGSGVPHPTATTPSTSPPVPPGGAARAVPGRAGPSAVPVL